MKSQRILIVEDEAIVAKNIEIALKKKGYDVPAMAASGPDAIEKAAQFQPDLVLMDIRLQGDMLGVEAAEQIHAHYEIPVVYLTSYSDEATLQRAMKSKPFGYLVKPFRAEDLHTTIAMALYKHEMDQRLRNSETRYRVVSELTSDFAYCVKVEPDGTLHVEWVTDAFTRITGYTADERTQKGLWADLVHPDDRPIAQEHLQAALSGQVDVSEYRIVRRDGEIRWLREHARPAWDEDEKRVVRFYAAAQDITDRKQAYEEREVLIGDLQDALTKVKTLSGLLPICSSCKKIRDDEGYWTAVEVYLLERSDAQFSHGLCPHCAHELYPDVFPSDTPE